mmetsp:Transcript_27152/g.83669  ORF Transcript_27152/g.83669 Transcript_27152/m.83669 type:complete len:582 (-) Transcript_27152:138-1883(-)
MLGARRALACALLAAGALGATWTPDEDALPRANRTWLERVADELDRSLKVYPPPRSINGVQDLIIRLLDDPARGVLVMGRHIVVDRQFFVKEYHQHKGLLHLDFLRALLERGASENVVYQFEWNADGFKSQDQLIRDGCAAPKRMGSGKAAVKQKSWHQSVQERPHMLPRLVIAKRYGYDQCGILVPNCYFESQDKWEEKLVTIARSSETQKAAKDKDPRVFWRGAIRNEAVCKDEGGNFARAEAVALSVAHPKLFDVKCLECDMRDDVKDPCLEFTFDEATRKALKDEKKIKGKYVPKADFGRYRYQLNLPGSVSGSYSRNLNHLWLVGSIVAMWDAPFVEFYYPALEEGDTHVAFDRTTAESTLKAVTPERSERLLKNARRVGEELLCPDCLANYWRLVIAKMRAHFKLADVLDNRKFVRRLLARFNMTNRELIAFHATPKGTQVHFITEKSQLAHVVYSGLNESETAKGPDPRRTANGAWNPLPPSYFQDMVRRRPTPPPTVKGANYGDGSNFLRSAVPDSLRFSTKLSLDKATGRLVSKVASARHRAKGVDDDGQFWHYSIDGNSNPVGGKRTGSWF